MKKIFLILLMAGLLFSLISYGLTFRNSIEAETFEELIESVLDFLFYIGLAAVPLMVVLGGFFIATAGGDSKRFKRGQNFILYAVIGLVVLLLARGIIAFIRHAIGYENGESMRRVRIVKKDDLFKKELKGRTSNEIKIEL